MRTDTDTNGDSGHDCNADGYSNGDRNTYGYSDGNTWRRMRRELRRSYRTGIACRMDKCSDRSRGSVGDVDNDA
jgi:hypothetical protein